MNINGSNIKKYIGFFSVFSVAKATVYFVPLLLADVLSEHDFGVLEYALAGLGFIVNALINLGVPGAYPYFILKQKQYSINSGFVLHPIWLLVLFITNQIAFFGFNLSLAFYIAFNLSYIIANQIFYSTQLKSHERASAAVIIDSGIYIVLLLGYLCHLLGVFNLNIAVLNYFIFWYAILYVTMALYRCFKHYKNDSFLNYKTILRFSVNIMLASFLIFLITTSGRILVEYFFDFKQVGVYAFYFRLAAIVVMIHQVVNIVFFKKMYTFKAEVLDRYYYLFFLGIFSLSILAFCVTPYVVPYVSSYFNDTYLEHKGLYFIVSGQMVMWIATALNANIINRENVVFKNNIKFLILVIISILLFYFLQDKLTLSLLTFCHFSIVFVAALIQYHTLYTKRIYFKKSAIMLLGAYLATTAVYFYWFNG